MSYPMRRVTIPTSKMDVSIQFYHDILGLTVFYDQVMEPDPESESLLGPEGKKPHRLVSLQQGDEVVGMLGLLDYMQPDLDIRPFEKAAGQPFPLVLVFTVANLEEVVGRVRDSGCRIVSPPQSWEIPGRGTGAGMSFVYPNGILIELTQLPDRDSQQTGSISPIRRVTVPVSRGQMTPTIRFYQAALGLDVFYDDVVVSEKDQSMLDLPGVVKTRLVSLQQGDTRFGMVGLLEYIEPPIDWQPFSKRVGQPYDVIFVFNVDDIDDVIARAEAHGGRLLARKTYESPQRGRADGVMLADPNGVVIDLTQFLG